MPYAAVNGIELHYRIDGDRHGHAPWIVLSNSLGSDMSMWTPQVAALSKKFRVLRYDTRGHGHQRVRKLGGVFSSFSAMTGAGVGVVGVTSASNRSKRSANSRFFSSRCSKIAHQPMRGDVAPGENAPAHGAPSVGSASAKWP